MDPEGTAVSLQIDAVKALAGRRPDNPGGLRSFDAMIEYASTRGWVDPAGEFLQANCEHE